MTADYTIDISKNIIQESKLVRITEQVYMYGFLFVGLFYIMYTYITHDSWEHYYFALVCFFIFIPRYLQTRGIWIYKKYFSITSDGIKWQKTIFLTGNLKWGAINQIHMQFPNINFELSSNKTKTFSLINITAEQIETIKTLLAQISGERNIQFTAA